MSNDKSKSEPMDPGARETTEKGHVVRRVRQAYALETLVAEVTEAFGEVEMTFGEPDEWQVVREVTFPNASDRPWLIDAFTALYHDPRVIEVDGAEDESWVYVRIAHNRRVQDSRDPFGIPEMVKALRDDVIEEAVEAGEPEPKAETPAPAKKAPAKKAAPK